MLSSQRSRDVVRLIDDYRTKEAEDWEYRALAVELKRWRGILDREWKLNIPVPLIEYQSIRNAYATYAWFRGSVGLPDVITINTDTLDRPAAYIIRTLGHEMLHLWQQYFGKPTQKRNWHNDEYIAKAAECGILIDQQGCTSGHDEKFAALIERYGIDLPDPKPVEPGILIPPTGGIEPKVYGTRGKAGAGSKMKKWSCGCTNVRCAVELLAVCAKCSNPFVKED